VAGGAPISSTDIASTNCPCLSGSIARSANSCSDAAPWTVAASEPVCSFGVSFEQWVTEEDPEAGLLRSALLAFEN
jgi:hypothetical protein